MISNTFFWIIVHHWESNTEKVDGRKTTMYKAELQSILNRVFFRFDNEKKVVFFIIC